jgi:CheY-like chemotaxis protein
MVLRALDEARELHLALLEIFVAHPGGKADRTALSRVEHLCDAAILAVDDVDCRVAMREVRSHAGVFFSEQGADALRQQIGSCLSAFRGRLSAIEEAVATGQRQLVTRRPPEQEVDPLAGALPPAAVPSKPLKILIVEDYRDAAESMRKLLNLCGYEVTVAYTGHEALQAARRDRPDIVLCDIGLPDSDGFSVASALREDPATAKARLIAVTAYGQDYDRRRALDAGFDLHLVKPVDPQALLRELETQPGR